MIAPSESLSKWLSSVDKVHPRVKEPSRRGRPYVYPTSVIVRCYLLLLVNPRLRRHSTLQAYLRQHAAIRHLLGLSQVPHRCTLSRRFRGLEKDLIRRIYVMGWQFICAGIVEVHILIADGTLHHAAGMEWPAKYQRLGQMTAGMRHIDTHAGWGKSPYHGWVWGYRTHPVVGLTSALEPIPILASARPANAQDNTLLAEQLPWLPGEATVLLLDSSYEDEALFQAWVRRDAQGLLERWMVVDPKKRPGRTADWRQQLQVWRYLEEHDLYKLRGELIEPFFSHWKEAFDLNRVPFQREAAPAFLLLAMYGYQLLIWQNIHEGRPTFAYQHLILGTD